MFCCPSQAIYSFLFILQHQTHLQSSGLWVKCCPTQPIYTKFMSVFFLVVFFLHFSLIKPEDTRGSQPCQPHSHWMHMAPIKVMFHQRSLFYLDSLLRLGNCSFSFGRVWIQFLIEALVTAIHEEIFNSPSKETKKLFISHKNNCSESEPGGTKKRASGLFGTYTNIYKICLV